MDLFAERSHDGASVADIQLAAGLTAGSGALYKHFTSKEAVLDAGVESYLATLSESSDTTVRDLPSDPGAALAVIAAGVLESMSSEEAVLRVLLRDLDRHPAQLERVWNGVLANVYTRMADWIKREVHQGRITVSDPEAVATVLMSALTNWSILRALINKSPGGLSRSAFAAAWVDVAARVIGFPPMR